MDWRITAVLGFVSLACFFCGGVFGFVMGMAYGMITIDCIVFDVKTRRLRKEADAEALVSHG